MAAGDAARRRIGAVSSSTARTSRISPDGEGSMELMLKPLRHYADFNGRARRKEFWSWFLFVWVLLFVLMYLDAALGLGGSASSYQNGASVGFSMSGGLLTALFGLATLIPNIAVGARRLHDTGKSGWFLLFGLIPLFGWAYLLFLYVQPGTDGPNAYGPDPKAADPGKVFS
jgi:uncharacterized membrane protein YhaH (DUF805 family)